MGHRKMVYNTDFSDLHDMVLYAYGKDKKIKSKKDVERLREVSRFRQYYAEGLKKESAVKQAWMPTVVFIILGIVFIFLLFS